MSNMKEQQIITVELRDLIESILGDDLNGVSDSPIPLSLAIELDKHLKDSLLWIVVFNDEENHPLARPRLWRYAEYKTSSDRYYRQKRYAEKERLEWFIRDKNVELLSKALVKSTGLDIESAKITAYTLIKAGNVELLKAMGMKKIITNESEL